MSKQETTRKKVEDDEKNPVDCSLCAIAFLLGASMAFAGASAEFGGTGKRYTFEDLQRLAG